MKYLLFVFLLIPNLTLAEESKYTLLVKSTDAEFSWNEIIPLSQAKDYYFKSVGVGIEESIYHEKNTEFKRTVSLQVGNYGYLIGVGGIFRPDFNLTNKLTVGPELNLGFEYLQTSSNAPHQTSQINLYSLIGPRFQYEKLGLGIFHYYSSMFGDTHLRGWTFTLFHNF